MTLVRAGFLAALLFLVTGFFASRTVVSSLMSHPTDTAPHPTAGPRPTATPRPTLPPSTPSTIRLPTVKPTPVRPPATPQTGTIVLERYWIAETVASRGQTISFSYVINNGTGRTARVLLGASIKVTSVDSWLRAVSDPAHDVVAVVQPGTHTYQRLFHLSPQLRPGGYDVAWGLRAARTGRALALVIAHASLTVRR